MSRKLVLILTLGLGAAVLSAIRVSTVPDDLLFMLPATVVVWGGVFTALRERRSTSCLSLWIAVPCWCWFVLLASNPVFSDWPEASIWLGLTIALIPASVLGLYRLLADDRAWDRLEWWGFGAAALVAVWMGWEYFALGLRADGPFLDANVATAVLYAALLPLIYRLVVAHDGRGVRGLLIVLAFVLAAGLFTGLSRGGLGSFVIALVGTVIVLAVCGTRAMWSRFALCLAVIGVAFAAVHFGPHQMQRDMVRDPAQDHSLQMRFVMWHAALQIYEDAPLTGTGLDTFSVNYPRYRPLIESGTVGDMVHNDYLQMLAEGGPLLLVLLVGFVLTVLVGAVQLLLRLRCTRAGPTHSASMRDMGLFAAILALAVHATVNFIFYALMLSLLTGLYAARLAGRHAVMDKPAPVGRVVDMLRQMARLLFGLVAVISVVVVGTAIISTYWLTTGDATKARQVSMDSGDYDLALALSYLNPLDVRAASYLGRAEAGLALGLGAGDLGAGLAVTALADLNSVLAVKHPDCSAQTIKGKVLTEFESKAAALRDKGVWQKPVEVLHDAIQAVPTCMGAYVTLADYWERKDDLNRAYHALAPAFPWLRIANVGPLAQADVLTTMARLQARIGRHDTALNLLGEVQANLPNYAPANTLRDKIEAGTLGPSDE